MILSWALANVAIQRKKPRNCPPNPGPTRALTEAQSELLNLAEQGKSLKACGILSWALCDMPGWGPEPRKKGAPTLGPSSGLGTADEASQGLQAQFWVLCNQAASLSQMASLSSDKVHGQGFSTHILGMMGF
ncbi:hypothetical protein NDU88_005193 [Pleurodeles waltl]|uniref:Uncharacterized protein n=1 Tax=Pleurodeles waltl TaxID=8319 RepID=A0AAV7LM60_PLEWA|nr:hypothetical protein NDU88_005193 [Pleurodeles waltl]